MVFGALISTRSRRALGADRRGNLFGCNRWSAVFRLARAARPVESAGRFSPAQKLGETPLLARRRPRFRHEPRIVEGVSPGGFFSTRKSPTRATSRPYSSSSTPKALVAGGGTSPELQTRPVPKRSSMVAGPFKAAFGEDDVDYRQAGQRSLKDQGKKVPGRRPATPFPRPRRPEPLTNLEERSEVRLPGEKKKKTKGKSSRGHQMVDPARVSHTPADKCESQGLSTVVLVDTRLAELPHTNAIRHLMR